MKPLVVGIMLVVIVGGVLLFAYGNGFSFDMGFESTNPKTESFTDCTMKTYGTTNADVDCPGEKTFYLIRGLPLKAAIVNDVTVNVKGGIYNVVFDTPLDIPVSYDLTRPAYDTQIYDDLKNIIPEIQIPVDDIREYVEQLSSSLKEIPLMVEHIIEETQDSVVIPEIKIPEIQVPDIQLPEIEQPKSPSLTELRQIALDDINKYRLDNNLRPISLGNAKSPQLFADELGKERCINHISDNGDGPMLRYKKNGDRMFLIFENVAGGYGSSWNMEGGIRDANYDMMFDDAHANWGHRDNILHPKHQSVSIGISSENGRLTIVQDFEQSLPPGYQYHPDSFKKQPVDEKFCW